MSNGASANPSSPAICELSIERYRGTVTPMALFS